MERITFKTNIPHLYVAELYRMCLVNATYKDVVVSTHFRELTGLENMPLQKLAEYLTQLHFNRFVESATKSLIKLVRNLFYF